MTAVIIRFEESLAICRKENKGIIKINKNFLPVGASEGDVLSLIGNRVTIDYVETRKRKNKLDDLIKDLLTE